MSIDCNKCWFGIWIFCCLNLRLLFIKWSNLILFISLITHIHALAIKKKKRVYFVWHTSNLLLLHLLLPNRFRSISLFLPNDHHIILPSLPHLRTLHLDFPSRGCVYFVNRMLPLKKKLESNLSHNLRSQHGRHKTQWDQSLDDKCFLVRFYLLKLKSRITFNYGN